MIRGIFHVFRYGPNIQKQKYNLGPVEFLKTMLRDADA